MNTVENMHFAIENPDKYENLVWDYKTGTIIDAETGEIVGEILYTDAVMGFRDIDKEEGFEHYAVLRQRVWLTDDQKRVWGKAWRYIVTSGLDVDPYLLARVVKHVFGANSKAPTAVKVAVAVVVALRMSGKPADVRGICRDLELEPKRCDKVFEVIRVMFKEGIAIPAENRYAKILKMVEQFPDKEVVAVAQRLLRHAKIDGKPSASIASTLIYIAGLLIDKNITMKSIAELYKVSDASIRNNKEKILPITIKLSKANVVEAIYIPKKICKDLEDFTLSPKVVCV
jgi:transcription initiation factor TFIIIB Brf1 subunit/transcription initiation factor TFIIB